METCKSGSERGAEESMVRNHHIGASASTLRVAEASESDRLLTQDMITATRPLGLKLLDHVIVAAETTFSFADSGLLDELELLCLAPGRSRRQPKLARETR